MNDPNNILSNFIDRATYDEKLLPSHISMFTAIYHLLKKTGTGNSVKITRKKVMSLAKINSISTYHRCINDLVEFNYIIYKPSYDHYLGSLVIFPSNKGHSYVPLQSSCRDNRENNNG